MNLTLAITNWNRYELLLESFAQVINDDRISEVLILDDCSDLVYWNKIKDLPLYNPKIRVIRQVQNRGMAINKRDAVSYAKTDWVILFDSDNIIQPDYLDALDREVWVYGWGNVAHTIHMPSFAKPNFDFTKYEGEMWRFKKLPPIVDDACNMLFNCCNYVVNRDEYLKVFEENPTVKGSDTIWFNYLWLKAGKAFHVVPGMEYYHRVHKDSGYLKDAGHNLKKSEETRKLIQKLWSE